MLQSIATRIKKDGERLSKAIWQSCPPP